MAGLSVSNKAKPNSRAIMQMLRTTAACGLATALVFQAGCDSKNSATTLGSNKERESQKESSYDPSVFLEFSNHVVIGRAISRNDPTLPKRIYNEAVNAPPPRGSDSLEGTTYKNFDKDVLLDLAKVNGFLGERLPEIVPFMQNFVSTNDTDATDMKRAAFNDNMKLMHNSTYIEQLNLIFGITNVDCRSIAITYAADYLARLGNTNIPSRVEFVTGIAFSKTICPTGEGHQWVVVDGKIIDPAIYYNKGLREDPPELGYVPIAGTVMDINGPHVKAGWTIYCYPSNIESTYSK